MLPSGDEVRELVVTEHPDVVAIKIFHQGVEFLLSRVETHAVEPLRKLLEGNRAVAVWIKQLEHLLQLARLAREELEQTV